MWVPSFPFCFSLFLFVYSSEVGLFRCKTRLNRRRRTKSRLCWGTSGSGFTLGSSETSGTCNTGDTLKTWGTNGTNWANTSWGSILSGWTRRSWGSS